MHELEFNIEIGEIEERIRKRVYKYNDYKAGSEQMEENYFSRLLTVDVSDKIEEKNGLSYCPWAAAWIEVKKIYPDTTYRIYERTDQQGNTVNYFTDGKTCWVKTGVTVNGIEHIEELPIMDFRNKSISLENVTSYDVNKTIQRSITKALARHGLGISIYMGEDLSDLANDLKSLNQNNLEIATKLKKVSTEMADKALELCKKYSTTGNPLSIKKIEDAEKLNTELKNLKNVNKKEKTE